MTANTAAIGKLLTACEELKGESLLMQQNNSIRRSISFTQHAEE